MLPLLVLTLLLSSGAAASGQTADPPDSLAALVKSQLRRIEALEARLAALQQEVAQLRQQPETPAAAPAEPPAAVRAQAKSELVDHAVAGEAPGEAMPEGPQQDLPRARVIDSYGSLRVAAAIDSDGNREIRNNSSRLGLRGTKRLTDGIQAFGRVEVGVNLVATDRVILSGGDPGVPIGQGSQAVFSRLGYVGLDTGIGSFAWGKQWSAYYDVAVFTDQFPLWSGAATGAFGAGTDGGISGTGRAEQALQYREARGPVSVALQMQSRNSSPNNQAWVDAWGASAVVGKALGISLAAAYNEVRDGVSNPNPNQPQLGDKAAIFGLRYRADRFYAATTLSMSEQHEVDDLGRRFDGTGFELALRYHATDALWLEAGYNDLWPGSDHPGDFRTRFGLGYVVYNFGGGSRVFGGFKVEDSRRSDGSKRVNSAFAAGLNYTF
jgi:predicted porin/cell division protein FtsB